MRLDDALIEAAKAFIVQRFGVESEAGAAALYTDDGTILISTAPAVLNPSVEVCHETGAIQLQRLFHSLTIRVDGR